MNKLKLLLAANYLNNFGWALYSPLYALFVLKIGGSGFSISILWAVYALVTGLLIMLFGHLENQKRLRPARMLYVGYGLFAVVGAGYLLVSTIWQFLVVQLVLACAMGIMTPASKATYMAAEAKGQEAGQWGIFDGGNYIIIAVAALVGGLLYKTGGFRVIFVVMILVQMSASYVAYRNWKTV